MNQPGLRYDAATNTWIESELPPRPPPTLADVTGFSLAYVRDLEWVILETRLHRLPEAAPDTDTPDTPR